MYSSVLAPERAGAAVAAPLPCHNGNISPLDDEICPLLPRKSVPTYYRRRKVEVENNIREFARKIGLKYGGDYMRPESIQEVARAHIAEFTITLARSAFGGLGQVQSKVPSFRFWARIIRRLGEGF